MGMGDGEHRHHHPSYPYSAPVDSRRRPAPRRTTLTAQGHPRAVFKRAIERGNLAVAEAMVREIGRVSLEEALELTALIAVKEPRRHERVAMRWLRLYLNETNTTLGEAVW